MITTSTESIPFDVTADMQAVADAVQSDRPIDPELSERIDENFNIVYKQLVERFGEREIAVELIRETRDES